MKLVSYCVIYFFLCCSACEKLVEALTHQLCEMEKVTLQHMNGATILLPEPLHFLLPEQKGLVTVVYPAGIPDSQLETQRKVKTTGSASLKSPKNRLWIACIQWIQLLVQYTIFLVTWWLCSLTFFFYYFAKKLSVGFASTVWTTRWQAPF